MDLFLLKRVSLDPKTENFLYRKLPSNVCSLES